MSKSSVIVCKPTQWIKIRAVLIIAMFSVFTYLFYKDGSTGYREKNREYVMSQLFNTQAQEEARKFTSEEEWREFAASQKIQLPSEEDCPLPLDFDRDQMWPQALVDGFDVLKSSKTATNSIWKDYAGEKGWDVKAADHPEDQGSLDIQFYMAYGCATLSFVVLVLFIRTLTRTMEVTDEAYIAPGGAVISFTSMRRIDIRKWDTKGVALIDYEEAGSTKKTKIDGMIYGQFKKEDGEPAERLYEFVMERFKGEVIEFESEEEDEASE